MPGKFIVIECVDMEVAKKYIDRVTERLNEDHDIPSTTPQFIWGSIEDANNEVDDSMGRRAAILTQHAQRAMHLQEVKNRLELGFWVVSPFALWMPDSEDEGLDRIKEFTIAAFVADEAPPDLTISLIIPGEGDIQKEFPPVHVVAPVNGASVRGHQQVYCKEDSDATEAEIWNHIRPLLRS